MRLLNAPKLLRKVAIALRTGDYYLGEAEVDSRIRKQLKNVYGLDVINIKGKHFLKVFDFQHVGVFGTYRIVTRHKGLYMTKTGRCFTASELEREPRPLTKKGQDSD